MSTSPLYLPPSLLDVFRIVSYAPIALFAESLRVYHGIIYAIATRSMTVPCLTGSIKDLRRLWFFDQRELFSEALSEHKWSVSSLRHGNTYTLVNKQLLELAGIIGQSSADDPALDDEGHTRPTTVHVSFVTPRVEGSASLASSTYTRLWYIRGITILQLLVHTAIAVGLALYGLVTSSLLISCIVASHIILLGLRTAVAPSFANRDAIAKDATVKASGGAALDIHVITSDWNSNAVYALCGYSSQLHALTNLPVRLQNRRWASRAFRLLALVLVAQASVLTSLLGCQTSDVVGPAIWLAVYLEMLLVAELTRRRVGRSKRAAALLLDRQPANVTRSPPLVFKGRRTALLFLASLPVSEKAGKWCWLDPYMPDNLRRREWQAEFEQLRERREDDAGFSADLKGTISDVNKALSSQPLCTYLKSYKSSVG